jgi:hypothetical protein
MMYKYCSLAIALFAGAANANPFAAKTSPSNAKAAYHAGLMKNAVPTKNSQIRQLEGDDNNNANQVDLTGYSLKFEKCQLVKSYSQDLAEEGAGTILATDRFVIFRLCPSGSCKNCNSNYGEYMVDMESYLGYTVEYRQDEQDEMCETCQETCNYQGDDNAGDDAAAQGDDQNQEEDNGDEERKLAYYSSSVDCDTCSSACLKIEGMEDNNYLDATNFINCQELENGGDDGTSIYAGPICASQGSKINIGVFTDEDCMFLDSSKDVEDYLADGDGNQMKLAHHLLKTTYDSSDCISCLAEVEGDDDAAAAETKEVCEELYQDSATALECSAFNNKRWKCKNNGCKWKNNEKKCKAPTSSFCIIFNRRGKCNKAQGCGWNRYAKECRDALSALECSAFKNKRWNCKNNGCKWKNTEQKCKGRWGWSS